MISPRHADPALSRGFGTSMANAAMVIMWPNSDGSITLSQRSAPGEVMPTVDTSPPFIATPQPSLSAPTGSTPKLAYTVSRNSTGTENIIYAFGSTNPGSSAVDATLVQHIAYGKGQLNLGNTLVRLGALAFAIGGGFRCSSSRKRVAIVRKSLGSREGGVRSIEWMERAC